MAARVLYIFCYLLAQCAFAYALQPHFQIAVAKLLVGHRGEHIAEGTRITENMVVNEADKPVKLHQVILEGCGGKQEFTFFGKGAFEIVDGFSACIHCGGGAPQQW